MTTHAGDTVVTVKKSHTRAWTPRVWKHNSGGWALDWLGAFVLLHNVDADRRTMHREVARRAKERQVTRCSVCGNVVKHVKNEGDRYLGEWVHLESWWGDPPTPLCDNAVPEACKW